MFNKLRNYFEMKINSGVALNVKLIEKLKYMNFYFSNLYLFVSHLVLSFVFKLFV